MEETSKEETQALALCTFYLRKLCTKGSACKFSHDCEEGSLPSTSVTERKRKRAKLKGDKTKLKDKHMSCSDCKKIFIFTVKYQAFYTFKGYDPPERCRACREYNGSKR